MPVTTRRTPRLALLAGLGALAAWVWAPAPAGAAGTDLLPDLRTLPHEQLQIAFDSMACPDTLCLHLSNTVVNRGRGPLEIYPEPTEGNDCDGDGDISNDREAYQRIFIDSADPNSRRYFIREHDTLFSDHLVGCMVFHPEHNHWHFNDFAFYALRAEPTGSLIGLSSKVSFCVLDGDRVLPGLLGSPLSDYYPGPCTASSVEGLSIGWADTYGAFLAGQSIPIAGQPAGNYCLISRSDPIDRLDESKETNNGRKTRLFLDPATREVQELSGACELSG